MAHTINEILDTVAGGVDLTKEQARFAFDALMEGELTTVQSGALLMGLRTKGEAAVEVAEAVQAALARARLVQGLSGKRLDVVGTGGDNSHSFNCSTGTSLTLAGMGYAVVKHGNRSVSSKCGSADAVEGLGLPLALEPAQVPVEVQKRGFAFLFAPHYHPAFKHIMPVRKELGVRTLFNILGPLLNPARPTHLLVGTARPEQMQLMAEVLMLSGVSKAVVVHGAGGLDELTPWGPARAVWVAGGSLVETELDPAELGIKPCRPEDVVVSGKEQAVAVLRELLDGRGPEPMREMLVFNTAVALHLLEDSMGMAECVERARGAVASGAGARVLHAG